MQVLWARQALTVEGWQSDLRVEINADGRIGAVEAGAAPEGLQLEMLLPAPVNAHSHAFQRAMAGLTERRGQDGQDSFWTWRRLMYRFLAQLTPDHVEAIAALVQMEMLEAGYATNVEFHYLHHQPDGRPYDRPDEMATRIVAAADETGIGLTLLPVQYQFGGCDGRALGAGQRRFGNTPDQYARLLQTTGETLRRHAAPDSVMGVAPHSIRAVAPEDLRRAPVLAVELAGGGPVHIHIAEQIAEVEEVQAAYGTRPVEWALGELPLSPDWCMIHATQMTPQETKALAATGAVAGLCPITESSLGDGIFDGVRWMDSGGKIAIGSDSNILISLAEEMRVLDHSQRLRDRSRAALASADRSAGRQIFDGICNGGARAAGRGRGVIAAGEWADLLSLDMTHIDLGELTGDTVLDAFAFTGRHGMVQHVWSAGRHMVRDGYHRHRDRIIAAYRCATRQLRSDI